MKKTNRQKRKTAGSQEPNSPCKEHKSIFFNIYGIVPRNYNISDNI